jgi:hypothetical protein
VVGILDPTNPVLAGSCDTPGEAEAVFVSGDHAYVADGDPGFHVIDISDPTNPAIVATYATPDYAWGVYVSGDHAYVADGTRGLLVIDISTPTNPTLEGSFNTPDHALDVHLSGEHAYVADHGSGLQVIRIAEPTLAPLLAGSCTTPAAAKRTSVAGDHAYTACFSLGLQVVDVSDPTAPVLVGSCDTPNQALGVSVSGDHAYVADQNAGLQVIDISDPANPTVVGVCATPGAALNVFVTGDHAYVASFNDGLQVVDISDPTTPTLDGGCSTTGQAFGVFVSGNHAYVADWIGVQVIDISDPTNPAIVGSYDPPGNEQDVFVSGDHAYVAAVGQGLQVIDILDPTNPSLAGGCDTPDQAHGVFISGNHAYVADHGSGLQVIDITDPTTPALTGSYDTSGSANGVFVSGDHAYVADGTSGLHAIRVLSGPPFNQTQITGQSLILNTFDLEIVTARLTTVQTGIVAWEISATNGADWQSILPDDSWNLVAVPGNEHVWRSTHTYDRDQINPTCSELTLDWLYEVPLITAIEDVPNDQGRQVRVRWTRNGYDIVGSPTPITEYAIYRKIDDDMVAGGMAPEQASTLEDNRLYPPGDWDFIKSAPACAEDEYSVIAPTLKDSTISEGMYYTTFFVRALTDTLGLYFDSPADSGYSVDNLSPGIPRNLAWEYPAELTWDESDDADFNYFTIYGSDSGELGERAVIIGYTTGTSFDLLGEEDSFLYYLVTATDFSGNEGEPASLQTPADVGENGDLPSSFALRPTTPNPFTGKTALCFDLPDACATELCVYDVSGRLVRRLVDRTLPAGCHRVVWDSSTDNGKRVPTGIYFARLQASGFRATERLVVLEE